MIIYEVYEDLEYEHISCGFFRFHPRAEREAEQRRRADGFSTFEVREVEVNEDPE